MKTKIIGFAIIFVGMLTLLASPSVGALGLKVAPLDYKTTLKANERQKGVIDVSNPTGQTVKIKTSVQAFKQIDDNGGLQFYDDQQVARGIKTDLSEFELGPREALRMSFVIDGAVLPEGDVYAAIFFTTEPAQPRNGVGQLVRVGTILSIVNKTPGQRLAVVTGVSMPFLQLSDIASGTYTVKNTGLATSGFYPTVSVSSWPSGTTKEVESSLVFGGRQRQNDFRFQTGFGIHYVKVSYKGNEKGQWIVTLAPWMLIAIVLILLIIGIELLLYKRRHKSKRKKTVPTS